MVRTTSLATERPVSVKPLGPRPLRKSRVAVENVVRGNVVDAGIAKDEVIGFVRGYPAAGLSDDDAEFALVGGFAVIGGGARNYRAGCRDAGRGLQQIQRLRRLRLLQLGGERVEIIPERHDLGRRGRRQQFDIA